MLSRLNLLEQFHYHDALVLWLQKDSLMEISFHIPNSNTQFVGDENRPSTQVSFFFSFGFLGLLIFFSFMLDLSWQNHVNGGCWCKRWRVCCYVWRNCDSYSKVSTVLLSGIFCSSMVFICHLYYVGFSLCRGWYNVELYLSFLRLQRQANDFKIQYSSVVRLFLLPKVIYYLQFRSFFFFFFYPEVHFLCLMLEKLTCKLSIDQCWLVVFFGRCNNIELNSHILSCVSAV